MLQSESSFEDAYDITGMFLFSGNSPQKEIFRSPRISKASLAFRPCGAGTKSVIGINVSGYRTKGFGKFNVFALVTCGFVLLYVTSETLGVGYLLNRAGCDLNLTVSEKGLIAGSTFLGVVSTAIFWGYLGDAYGRRRVMLPALFSAILTSFCSSLAVNFWNLFLLRLLTGALISASVATVYAFLGELVPAPKRSKAVSWASAFIAFSFVIMPGMAWIILPQHWSFHVVGELNIVPWRMFMWSCILWGLLASVGLLMLPESPRYLLCSKGPAAVLPALAKMYAWNHNRKSSEYPVTSISAPGLASRPTFRDSMAKLLHIARPPLRCCVLLSHTCIFLLFMQTSAFYVWMPHIVNELLNSNTVAISMCEVMKAKQSQKEALINRQGDCNRDPIDSRMYPISMVMGLLTAMTYVAIGQVMDKWGRRKVFCALVTFCSALTLAAGVVPHAYVAIAMLIPGLCGGAGTSVLATLTIEVFPTSLRAMVLCTLFMMGRLGAALGSTLLGQGLQNNCVLATVGITCLSAGSTLLMALWPDGARIRAAMEAKDFTY